MRILTCLLLCAATLAATPSCTLTPEQKAKVLEFTDNSLKLAVDSGALKPGYSVLIGAGVGLVTSLANPEAKPKQVPLATLGLDQVVASGEVKKGDTVVVREADAVVISKPISLGPISPASLPAPPN